MTMPTKNSALVEDNRYAEADRRVKDVISRLSRCRTFGARVGLVFAIASVGLVVLPLTFRDLPAAFSSSSDRARSQSTASARAKTLQHDFGLIRPGQVCTTRFSIQNDSAITWTLRSLSVGCACTVTHLSKLTIAPGERTELDVKYTAGAVSVDDKRAIGVIFNEASAPAIRVELAAHVRAPATAEPQEAILPVVEPTATSTGYFTVMNFSDDLWSSVQATASEPWITLTATKREVPSKTSGSPTPTQVWTVAISARSTGLKEGMARAVAQVDGISTEGRVVASVDVPVLLRTEQPLTAVPASAYFNNANTERSQRVRVFVHRDEFKLSADAEIHLAHNLGEHFTAVVVDVCGSLILIDARLDDYSPTQPSAGVLKFSICRGSASASLDIPIVIACPSTTAR
jgi:hypothetical protein